MKLVGTVAKEAGLTGDETLSELINHFSSLEGRIHFDDPLLFGNELLEDHELKRMQIQKAILEIRSELPWNVQEADYREAISQLVNEYLCNEFGSFYDELSPDFFQVERIIPYLQDEGKYNEIKCNIEIPLLARVRIQDSKWTYSKRIQITSSRSQFDVSLNSGVPPITREAKGKVREAQSRYLSLLSDTLNLPSLGDLIMGDMHNRVKDLSFSINWIPKPSELNISVVKLDPDPFITADLKDKHYLVAQWDVEGELPYQHYLKEFRK